MYRDSKRQYKVDAIVLKRINVKETDRILTVFTRTHGKLRLLAKGVRKISSKRGPHLEVFSHSAITVYAGRSMEQVSDVTTIESFGALRTDLSRISLAYYACELVDSLLADSQAEHANIFDLLLDVLRGLDRGDVHPYASSTRFTNEVLWSLGFMPREQTLTGAKLASFIESITERPMKSTSFAKVLITQADSLTGKNAIE